MRSLILLSPLLFSAARSEVTAPTLSTVAELDADIRSLIDVAERPYDSDKPLIAGLVRLAFHDCTGGCDGCINIENESNLGLEWVVETVEPLYEESYEEIMSRADFWSIAATLAWLYGVEIAATGSVAPEVTHYYGREDCNATSAPYYLKEFAFPPGVLDNALTLFHFAQDFDFSTEETVAILGAHTLGQARLNNSGFHGQWVLRKNAFDNQYYKDLINAGLGWNQKDNTQWEHECLTMEDDECTQYQNGFHAMMMNADISLYKHIQVADIFVSGMSNCTYDECALSTTASLVEGFAEDDQLFLDSFAPAWSKMITTVADGIELYEVISADTDDADDTTADDDEESDSGESGARVVRACIHTVLAMLLCAFALI